MITTFESKCNPTWTSGNEDGWADFSELSRADQRPPSLDAKHPSNADMVPPTLSLPLQHYCMIAEKVFIAFLRLYRKLYVQRDIVSVDKVHVHGKRLRTFLTVVLPSHPEYGSVMHNEESVRICQIGQQLEEYIDNLKEMDAESVKTLGVEDLDDLSKTHDNLLGFSTSSDSSTQSCCSSGTSVFDNLDPDSIKNSNEASVSKNDLKPTSSDEQTFCSSVTGGATVTILDTDTFQVIQTKPVKVSISSASSTCSQSSGFENSVTWDNASVCGQIGSYHHDHDSISIGSEVYTNTSTVSAEFSADGWADDSSCDRIDFQSLMNLWREKECGSMCTPKR